MGYDFVGLGGLGHRETNFNNGFWGTQLDIAEIFDWQPAGTIAPPDRSSAWSGQYCGNDFQEVTDADARALGEALHRALAALRTVQVETIDAFDDAPECSLRTALAALKSGQALTKDQAKVLCRIGAAGVREFADFACSSGGFVIS
jgi:hypothetical protein